MLSTTTFSAEPEDVPPEEADKLMLGKYIAVEGAVSNLSRYNQHTFFQIKKSGSINAAIFSRPELIL